MIRVSLAITSLILTIVLTQTAQNSTAFYTDIESGRASLGAEHLEVEMNWLDNDLVAFTPGLSQTLEFIITNANPSVSLNYQISQISSQNYCQALEAELELLSYESNQVLTSQTVYQGQLSGLMQVNSGQTLSDPNYQSNSVYQANQAWYRLSLTHPVEAQDQQSESCLLQLQTLAWQASLPQNHGFTATADISTQLDSDTWESCSEGERYASQITQENQGNRKDGSGVLESRSDSNQLLGQPDGDFYSLGYGGDITLEFETPVTTDPDNPDLQLYEVTNGNRSTYPEENAKVEVSQDGQYWVDIGTISSYNQINNLDFGDDFTWIQYLRITDTTDPTPHLSLSDGIDLDAIRASSSSCNTNLQPEPYALTENLDEPENFQVQLFHLQPQDQYQIDLTYSHQGPAGQMQSGITKGGTATNSEPITESDFSFESCSEGVCTPHTNPEIEDLTILHTPAGDPDNTQELGVKHE